MRNYRNKQNRGDGRGGNRQGNRPQNFQNSTRFPVPIELQKLREELLKSNFALTFQKYLEWKQVRGKWECKDYKDFAEFRFDANFISSVLEKQKLSLNAYAKENGLNVKLLDFTNDYRLTCGLGSSSVWAETGMTLHHVYGFPFIPGSSVKGLVRMLAEKKGKDFANKLFGDDDKTGSKFSSSVDFFDVFPMEARKIQADIMNPHYGDYYSKKEVPGDWLSPIPVNFLTVQGGRFRFPFVCKRKEDVETVEKLLKEALADYGIGGKTKVGYGYFS